MKVRFLLAWNLYKNIILSYKINNIKVENSLKYSLRFTSLVPPSSVPKISILNNLVTSQDKFYPKKNINVKHSYILMSWMYYVKMSYSESNELKFKKLFNIPTIFCYPKRTQTFTHTKAPIAHKTFSQEQFKFKFYFLSVSFNISNLDYDDYKLNSINKSLYLMLNLRNFRNVSATNLFILKRFYFKLSFFDKKYLFYNNF